MMASSSALTRHNEIRKALRFFLNAWYKHKQHGSYPEPRQVMIDFARYAALSPVVSHLAPPAPTVQPDAPDKQPSRRRESEQGRNR